jgi:hypothetical protein
MQMCRRCPDMTILEAEEPLGDLTPVCCFQCGKWVHLGCLNKERVGNGEAPIGRLPTEGSLQNVSHMLESQL